MAQASTKKKGRTAAETSHVVAVPSSSSEKSKVEEWLINIMKDEGQEIEYSNPKIQKVKHSLRQSNPGYFDPSVVSFGMHHHDKTSHRFSEMKRYKKVTARWFISLAAKTSNKLGDSCSGASTSNTPITMAKIMYDKFVNEVKKMEPSDHPRNLYAQKLFHKYSDEEFMQMMFEDGCFILHFIHLVVKGSKDDHLLKKSSHELNQPLILRDMFLLENQIPYTILEVLMSLMPEKNNHPFPWEKLMEDFIDIVVLPLREPSSWREFISNLIRKLFQRSRPLEAEVLHVAGQTQTASPPPRPHPHLLHFLRSKLINQCVSEGSGSSFERGHWNYYFRPVMELKVAGIELSRSYDKRSRKIEFKSGLIYGHLKLPQITIDGTTKTRLLNLIAYETCPDSFSDRAVISYICFLDSLIYNVDDVEELRSKKILYNRLRSDDEVVKLFKELATNLTPNNDAYTHVMEDIKKFSKRPFNHIRLWIGQIIHTHFSTPWTLISLLAAIFIVSLTLVQTIYTVLGYY